MARTKRVAKKPGRPPRRRRSSEEEEDEVDATATEISSDEEKPEAEPTKPKIGRPRGKTGATATTTANKETLEDYRDRLEAFQALSEAEQKRLCRVGEKKSKEPLLCLDSKCTQGPWANGKGLIYHLLRCGGTNQNDIRMRCYRCGVTFPRSKRDDHDAVCEKPSIRQLRKSDLLEKRPAGRKKKLSKHDSSSAVVRRARSLASKLRGYVPERDLAEKYAVAIKNALANAPQSISEPLISTIRDRNQATAGRSSTDCRWSDRQSVGVRLASNDTMINLATDTTAHKGSGPTTDDDYHPMPDNVEHIEGLTCLPASTFANSDDDDETDTKLLGVAFTGSPLAALAICPDPLQDGSELVLVATWPEDDVGGNPNAWRATPGALQFWKLHVKQDKPRSNEPVLDLLGVLETPAEHGSILQVHWLEKTLDAQKGSSPAPTSSAVKKGRAHRANNLVDGVLGHFVAATMSGNALIYRVDSDLLTAFENASSSSRSHPVLVAEPLAVLVQKPQTRSLLEENEPEDSIADETNTTTADDTMAEKENEEENTTMEVDETAAAAAAPEGGDGDGAAKPAKKKKKPKPRVVRERDAAFSEGRETMRKLCCPTTPIPLIDIAWSPHGDARHLVGANAQGEIHLWDLAELSNERDGEDGGGKDGGGGPPPPLFARSVHRLRREFGPAAALAFTGDREVTASHRIDRCMHTYHITDRLTREERASGAADDEPATGERIVERYKYSIKRANGSARSFPRLVPGHVHFGGDLFQESHGYLCYTSPLNTVAPDSVDDMSVLDDDDDDEEEEDEDEYEGGEALVSRKRRFLYTLPLPSRHQVMATDATICSATGTIASIGVDGSLQTFISGSVWPHAQRPLAADMHAHRASFRLLRRKRLNKAIFGDKGGRPSSTGKKQGGGDSSAVKLEPAVLKHEDCVKLNWIDVFLDAKTEPHIAATSTDARLESLYRIVASRRLLHDQNPADERSVFVTGGRAGLLFVVEFASWIRKTNSR